MGRDESTPGDRKTPESSQSSRGTAAEELFHRALEEPASGRHAWLAAATTDESLRAFVAELLAHHREDDRLTEIDDIVAADLLIEHPSEVGPYRIVGELGTGGMGVVYEAERADLGMRVALKLARERFPSVDRARRFDRERRVLARLQHSNIAQLHDAGVTDEGRPYFAMEIVDGDDIVRHASRAHLSTGARLELFLDACEAVRYAHQSLVVHRDIKPSNVLVTRDGRVKLLDFGVAKLLEEGDAPGLTRTEARVYTPGYAAPEQLRGEPVTTATDVYQLGALLYELLSEAPAYDVGGLAPYEAERLVLEADPPPPSRREGREGAAAPHHIPRDLDSISLKALEKEPARRYASVEALGEDVRRYLDGLPVRARPSTPTYRLRRFARRHRFGVATAAAFAALLVGSVAVLGVQQAATVRERDRAREAANSAVREAEKADRTTSFLVGLFEGSDPSVAQGDTLTARELLARGTDRIDALGDQPEVQATLLGTIGRIQSDLGNEDESSALLRRALNIWATVPDPDPVALAEARLRLGENLSAHGGNEEAVGLFRAVATSAAARASPDLRSRALFQLFGSLHGLQLPEADSVFRAWQEGVTDWAGRGDARAVPSMIRLAQTLQYRGESEEARVILRRAVAQARQFDGSRHPALAAALAALGDALKDNAPDAEADSVTREAVALNRLLYPEGHRQLASALHARALFLRNRGELAEAEALIREALEMDQDSPGPDGINFVNRNRELGFLLAERGALEEAERRLRDTSAWWRRNFGADHIFTTRSDAEVGAVLRLRGQYQAAEAILLSAYERLLNAEDVSDYYTQFYTQYTIRQLTTLYDGWGRADEASSFRRLLAEP